jgi:CTP synthase
MIETLTYIRENNVPCLGICLGLQLMTIEYLRNVLDIKNANSLEFDKKCAPNDAITLLDSQK